MFSGREAKIISYATIRSPNANRIQVQPLSLSPPEHTQEQYGSLFSDSDTSREHYYRCRAIIFDTKYILIKKEAQRTMKAKGTLIITTTAKEKETQTNNHDHEEHLDNSSTTLFDGGQMSC